MPIQTIDSDTEILTGQFSQVITSDTGIQVTQSQLLTSDTAVVATLLRFLTGNTDVMIRPAQTITSDTEVLVNEVVLKLFRQADLTVEIGTTTNPLDFGTIEAGETVSHPDNPFVLFNDKGGSLKSVDARDVTIRVVQLDLIDELVGFSNGSPGQSFTVAFPPVVDDSTLITAKVNDVPWTRVTSFAGLDPTSEAYVFNALTGQVQFGDGIQGKVPPNGHTIKVSYSPDTILHGKQAAEQLWIGVQSNGVLSSSVAVSLERRTPLDVGHVAVLHKPLTAVSGVWLATDPNRLGTNFFPGGSFDAAGGVITLDTPLPDLSQDVFVDYAYTIADDLEGGFTQIGRTVAHSLANPIPGNNAKKLNFRAVVPPSTSPSGLATIRFKVRCSYRQ